MADFLISYFFLSPISILVGIIMGRYLPKIPSIVGLILLGMPALITWGYLFSCGCGEGGLAVLFLAIGITPVTMVSMVCFNAGRQRLNDKSSKELESQVDQNNPEALFQTGINFQLGRGIKINQTRAAYWYSKAAEKGHPDSMNNLGLMYQFGNGVRQSYFDAVNWFRKAIEKGSGDAYSNLGYMYEHSLGVERDLEQAIQNYKNAIEKGVAQAMYNLGLLYWNGTGVTLDLVEAYKWIFLFGLYRKRSLDNQEEMEIQNDLQNLENNMTKEQISSAKERAQQWQVEHPKT